MSKQKESMSMKVIRAENDLLENAEPKNMEQQTSQPQNNFQLAKRHNIIIGHLWFARQYNSKQDIAF